MGGVSSFRFLTTYNNDNTLPKVNKFVALGSPFNEFIDSAENQTLESLLSSGPEVFSPRFVDFQNSIGNLSEEIEFLLIGGKSAETDSTDGMVPLTSALAIHSLLLTNGNPVQYAVMQNTDHSGLHENAEVDQLVEEFFWQ